MGRKRINEAAMIVRVRAGMPEQIDGALKEGEKQADFLRAAIEEELKRRERAGLKRKRRVRREA